MALPKLLLLLLAAAPAAAQARPAITGISHMCVLSADPAASEHFYTHNLQAQKLPDPEDPAGARYTFSPTQFVEVLPLPADHTLSRMSCVAWNTPDAAGLRAFLQSKNIPALSPLRTLPDGSHVFSTKDPEGNLVKFVQPTPGAAPTTSPISNHIIHVGYLVHDRAAEDRFYKDVLGFRPYWHGAANPGKTDWISLQVPDGHDWIEYMMDGEGSDSPADQIDARRLSVMNHFSLGVPNMEQAVTTLIAGDRLSPHHDGPQMGKDGKWQANYYDPDGTRVELMEFQPVIKPCCSDFTADSPTR